MPKSILDDIDNGVMPLPKGGKKPNFNDVKPLPSAPYKTPKNMGDDASKYDQFMKSRSADDKPGTSYTSNGVTVTGEEMDAIKQSQLDNRSPEAIEMDDMATEMRNRARAKAAQRKSVSEKASGGRIGLKASKVSTAQQNPKHKNCW